MNHNLRQLLAFLLAVLLASGTALALYTWDNKYTSPGVQGLDGLLVLTEEELEKHPIHYLIHGWALYPGVLLEPEDFRDGTPRDYMVYTSIGEHTRFDFAGGDSSHGCASYVLHLELPETEREYALTLPEIYSAYRLYLDGRPVMQMGNPDDDAYLPRTQERMVIFRAAGHVTLLLAVRDESHFYSGLVYPPALGSPLSLNLLRGGRLAMALTVSLVGLVAALLSAYSGAVMRRRDALLFSLLCFTAALYAFYPILHTVWALPVQPWYALEIFGGSGILLLVILLQNHLCQVPWRMKWASSVLAGALCLCCLCYGLFSAYLTVPAENGFSLLLLAGKLAAAVYLFFVSLRSGTGQRSPVFYAPVFYAALLIWDRLLPVYEPAVTGWFSEWGSLSIILAIGCTLWRDMVAAYANSFVFAAEQRRLERQLAMQLEYAQQITDRSAENRRILHDFRQHLRVITRMAQEIRSQPETEPQMRELLHYLEEFPGALPQPSSCKQQNLCNRAAVDALLQYYDTFAARQGIHTRLAVYIPDGAGLSDMEWCSILGNLLENAIEGCQRQETGERRLSLVMRTTELSLFCMVENTYDGQYQKQNGVFLTRKTGQPRLGIGLESVRGTVLRHGGMLDIFPLEHVFRVGIILPLDSA